MEKITGNEFNDLPPVIRRKFFSSVERLRLEQTCSPPLAVDDSSMPQPTNPSMSRDPSGSTSFKLKAPRPSTSITAVKPDDLSQADALWFLSLPDKVKHQHFTKEERSIMQATCADITSITNEKDLHKFLSQQSMSTKLSHTSRKHSLVLDDETTTALKQNVANAAGDDGGAVELHDNKNSTINSRQTSQHRLGTEPRTAAIAGNMKKHLLQCNRATDPRAHMDEYHAFLLPEKSRKTLVTTSPSFRRAVPAQAQAPRLPMSSSGHALLPLPPPPAPSMERGKKLRKLSVSGMAPGAMAGAAAPRASTSSGDAGATYYRDPEARLKLRVYLGSPQKFDEAVEFGFPSVDLEAPQIWDGSVDNNNNGAAAWRPRTSQSARQTFYNDADDPYSLGNLYQFGGDFGFGNEGDVHEDDGENLADCADGDGKNDNDADDDDASAPDLDQPVTPVELETSFRPAHRLPYAAKLPAAADPMLSRPAGMLRPLRQFESFAFAPPSSREMTLRLTLTRPDLQEPGYDGTGGTAARSGSRTWRTVARPAVLDDDNDDPLKLSNDLLDTGLKSTPLDTHPSQRGHRSHRLHLHHRRQAGHDFENKGVFLGAKNDHGHGNGNGLMQRLLRKITVTRPGSGGNGK